MLIDRLLGPLTDARPARSRLRVEAIPSTPGPDHDFWYGPTGAASQAGLSVTPTSALCASAVWSAVDLLSCDLAKIPLHIYRRLPNGGKKRARAHPLYDVIHSRPNAWQSAYDYWQLVMRHLLLRGNHYSVLVPGPRGFADQLVPLPPDAVTVKIEAVAVPLSLTGLVEVPRFWYEWHRANGQSLVFNQHEVWHLRGASLDGLVGVSVITYARESIGLMLATETYGAKFFGQGSKPVGILKTPNRLSPTAAQAIKARWEAMHAGLSQAHRVAVLEEGLEWQAIGLNAEDAQYLQTREFGVHDAARWFKVPASRLQAQKTSTYASAYMYDLEYVESGLQPWATCLEQAINRDLINADRTYFAEFLLDAMLRGDPGQRASFYHSAVLDGWMTRNEVRTRENLNPLPGLDEPLEPRNMAPAGTQAPSARATAIVTEAAARVVRKELAALRKLAQRTAQDSEAWAAAVREFYERHCELVQEALQLTPEVAQQYVAQQCDRVLEAGLADAEHWPATVVPTLVDLALKGSHVHAMHTDSAGMGPRSTAGDAPLDLVASDRSGDAAG